MNIDYPGDAHGAILWTVIGLVLLALYFVPSFIAFSKNHPSKMLILLLNILLGGTIIGWVVLLVWANKK